MQFKCRCVELGKPMLIAAFRIGVFLKTGRGYHFFSLSTIFFPDTVRQQACSDGLMFQANNGDGTDEMSFTWGHISATYSAGRVL